MIAVLAFALSLFVGATIPAFTWQYRVAGLGLALISALPFIRKVNLQGIALAVHYVGMYSTMLGIIAGGYYLYTLRGHQYIFMFVGLLIARMIFNLIPIWRVIMDKDAKDSFTMKINVHIAVLSHAVCLTATIAALIEGIFPIISYGWMILGVEIIYIIWKEFGVKGSSTLAATAASFISGNASAMMILTLILMFLK